MDKKICFVIMGFAEKKDPKTNRTINLDETYKKIIRPAVEASECICVRADEINDSGIIDRSMYALLYKADIVIADISTYNPNAIYELGVRHTLRKKATIIIKEDQGEIPFDLNHNRVLSYNHLGDTITPTESARCVTQLKLRIDEALKNNLTDSPLYSYIDKIIEPSISDEDIKEIIGELKEKEDSIFSLTEKARLLKKESKFKEAAECWDKLSKKVESEIYYIQQKALCIYKSQDPSRQMALTDALSVIQALNNCKDSETLGINGAIYKNLWLCTQDVTCLDRAISLYKESWNIHKDFYTGENYATCLDFRAKLEAGEEKIYYTIEARKTREEIVDILLKKLADGDGSENLMWVYATLSNCYLAAGNNNNAAKYEQQFLQCNPEDWEKATFNETKDTIND